jgi:hypothetical protein
MRLFCGVLAMLLLGSQLAQGQERYPAPPGAPASKKNSNCTCNGKTFVLVVNGESEMIDVKDRLDSALENSTCQIFTRSVAWTSGDTAGANYRNTNAQIIGAVRLAQEVQRIHQCFPASAIVLIGYCAGARVVLVAADQLPPGSVDRIILLSPAVSAWYDPRTAIKASKNGIDVFYSSEDTDLETREPDMGTGDPVRTAIAGRSGFMAPRNYSSLSRDPVVANGMRQYDISQCGYLGGHYATISVGFLRRCVVPLIPCGRCVPAGEGGTLPVPQLPPPQAPYPGPQGPNPGPQAPYPAPKAPPTPPVPPPMPAPTPTPPGYNGPAPIPTPPPALPRTPNGPVLPPPMTTLPNGTGDAPPPPPPPPLPPPSNDGGLPLPPPLGPSFPR